MAAANYMTEEDSEGLWDFEIATARFALIGVRMAEILNHRVNKDSTQQVVDTAHTPILEQISEECMHELIAAGKETGVTDPWLFIQANVMAFMNRKLRQWKDFLDNIQLSLEKKHIVKYSNQLRLPSHGDVRVN